MSGSFDGNDGNDGNVGSAGGSGNSLSVTGGWFFADRVDLPFVTISDPVVLADQRINITQYPARAWGAEWLSWVAVTQLAQTNWMSIAITTPIPTGAALSAEIDGLVTAAQDERADTLGEILSQSDEFVSYFMNAMSARPGAYPATALLLQIASLIGTFTAMHHKYLFKRPRPSMLCPALLPPIAVPGHASFPSGHSTQAHLMALCMDEMFTPPTGNPLPQQTVMHNDLLALANRIARNREIAGLHYPSDSVAGAELAGKVHTNLMTQTMNVLYQATVIKARAEWA